MPTFEDWQARIRDLELDKAKEREHNVELYKQEMSDASRLTGDPRWDKFLTQLQPMLKEAKQIFEESKERGITQVQDEAIKVCQFKYWYEKGRIEALTFAMSLPQKIVEEYKVETHS